MNASLLDKLLNAGSDVPSADQVRRGILRDIQDLLNARRPWRTLVPGRTGLDGTVRTFGLPDFTNATFSSQEQTAALLHEIARTIERFEPRLRNVKVGLGPHQRNSAFLPRLLIEAELSDGGAHRMPVSFEAQLDGATNDLMVTCRDG